MNEILYSRDMLFSSNIREIGKSPRGSKKINTLWGLEYFLFNEKSFIEKNINEIVDIMLKSRKITA